MHKIRRGSDAIFHGAWIGSEAEILYKFFQVKAEFV
jgi:hypothetical protein